MHVTLVQGDAGLIARKVAASDLDRTALEREAEVLQLAAHPGVVRLLEVTETHLDTAAVGHRTLATSRPASPGACAAFVAGVADILADLHRAGIVHGALEPSHVLIDDAGRPVLCGWRRGGRVGEPMGGALPAGDDPAPVLRPSRDVFGLGRLLGFLLDGSLDDLGLTSLVEAATATEPDIRPSAAAVASGIRHAIAGGRTHQGREQGTSTSHADNSDHRRPPIASPARQRRALMMLGAVVVVLAAALVRPDGDATASRASSPEGGTPAPPGSATGEPGWSMASSPRTHATPSPTSALAPVPEPPACDAVLIPTTPPFPAPPCTRSAPLPSGGLDAGGLRYAIGEPGDEILVVDVGCTGQPSVALVRPATGLVAVFPGWATPGAELEAELRRPVPPGSHLETSATGPGSCPQLLARTPDDIIVAIT